MTLVLFRHLDCTHFQGFWGWKESLGKRIIAHEYKDRADEVPQDFQLQEESRSGESLFTKKLSDDTDSGTTLQSVPLQGHKWRDWS